MIDDNPLTEEVDLRALLRPLRRYWWLVVAIVVVVTAATYYVDARKPKVYQASTSVFVNLADNTVGQFAASGVQVPSSNAVADLARLAESDAVGERLKRALNSPAPPRNLLAQVSAIPEASADFVDISAVGPTPSAAANLANAYAQAFVAVGQHQVMQQLTQLLQATSAQLAATKGTGPTVDAARLQLTSRLGVLHTAVANAKGPEEQVNPAAPPSLPFSPRPKRVALFGFFLSLLGAIVLVYLLDRVDRRIKQVEDLSDAYGLPLLGVVPHVSQPALVAEGHAALDREMVEAVRFLRVNLSLQSLDRPLRLLLVTSAIPGEGKSTVVRNLALAFREAGVDVATVDADLRRPSLARGMGWTGSQIPGLTNVLLGEADLAEAVVRADVVLPGLDVRTDGEEPSVALLPSGSPAANPPAVLGSSRMVEVLHDLAATHELVIIDSPPLLAVSDTLPLLSIVDGVILVGRVGHTTYDAVRRVKAALARTPSARVVGLVADDDAGAAGYGYTYGYSASRRTTPTAPLAKARRGS